ncbi:hypothetical protein AZE42_09033 [Rhizopogon vesiculosus]|uniref:Hydrophobin n=1 Tax=Rhizopogon vesiculosus TaxID=180088 RepID=A0A1J8Q824_9AGAM|nr:hypothetical protein AZE42_09033 [Rhizopogon vesiculosus]
MRFSFLTVVVTLTAAMSVSACSEVGQPCNNLGDCCWHTSYGCDVSMRNVLCI